MISYSIEPKGNSYLLTVWEPASITPDRVNPFVFKAHYILESPLEAFELLRLIQGGNGTVQSSVPGQLAKAIINHQKVS
jgi:hypothetical protein